MPQLIWITALLMSIGMTTASAAKDDCDKKLLGMPFSAVPHPEKVVPTGRTVTLWRKNRHVDNYRKLLKNLEPGDIIDFGNGDTFTFARIYGQGQTTLVIKTAEGFVLRIPKFERAYGGLLQEYIEDFVSFHKVLRDAGINVVNLDLQRSRAPRFLVVEELKVEFTLEEFFGFDVNGRRIKTPNLSPDKRKKIYEQFLEMVPFTWPFERMANFSGRQLGWVDGRWVMFDIEPPLSYIGNFKDDQTTFDPVLNESDYGNSWDQIVPGPVLKEVRKIVAEERRRQKEKYDWFQRKSGYLGSGDRWLLRSLYRQDELVGKIFSMTKDNLIWHEYALNELPRRLKLPFKILSEVKRYRKTVVYQIEFLKNSKRGLLELAYSANLGDALGMDWKLLNESSLNDVIKYGDDFILFKE